MPARTAARRAGAARAAMEILKQSRRYGPLTVSVFEYPDLRPLARWEIREGPFEVLESAWAPDLRSAFERAESRIEAHHAQNVVVEFEQAVRQAKVEAATTRATAE